MNGPKSKREQVVELAECMIADLDQKIAQLDPEDTRARTALMKSRARIVKYLQKTDQLSPDDEIIPPDFF